jgi:GNAT superfamily N-acetyltransferase
MLNFDHTTMNITLRPFTGSDADYAAMVDVVNSVYPDYPETVAEVKFGDANQPAHIKKVRWMAERDGAVLGYANYHQFESMYHPRRFGISAVVPPQYRQQGIGAALYDTVLAALAEHDPLSVRARYRSDSVESERFLAARGFVEDMRDWESRLNVSSFDPTPFLAQAERATINGIRIVALAELIARDPQHPARLYDLDMTLSADVPSPEPFTPISREQFAKWVFANPNLLPEGYFVALDGNHYVGSSALWKSQSTPQELYTGLTGVRREYRRKGIALALKLHAIDFARSYGTTVIKTWNESNNRGMLSINEALGFVKQPIWVNVQKTL